MGSKLLTNGYVVTVDGDRTVHPNGFVHVEDERISAVGPTSELGDRAADETIDLHGKLALPGLINLHNHHWASLFKNTGEGLLLEPWLDQVTIPLLLQLTNETLRVSAYLGAKYVSHSSSRRVGHQRAARHSRPTLFNPVSGNPPHPLSR